MLFVIISAKNSNQQTLLAKNYHYCFNMTTLEKENRHDMMPMAQTVPRAACDVAQMLLI